MGPTKSLTLAGDLRVAMTHSSISKLVATSSGGSGRSE